MDKKDIFDLINKNKQKIFCSSKPQEKLIQFLEKNNIILPIPEINSKEVFYYLSENPRKCKNSQCDLERRFNGWQKQRIEFCSEKCFRKHFSEQQKGSGNTWHRTTEETRKAGSEKLSYKLKLAISEGRFIPDVTNSWANSRAILNLNGKEKKYRSTWEAFFQLVNPELEYEKVVIPYFDTKRNSIRNYIIDFVDKKMKILFEIKPNSKLKEERNINKIEAAKMWCIQNNYEFKTIDEDWFLENFPKNKHLAIGHPSSDKILKNLKQFE